MFPQLITRIIVRQRPRKVCITPINTLGFVRPQSSTRHIHHFIKESINKGAMQWLPERPGAIITQELHFVCDYTASHRNRKIRNKTKSAAETRQADSQRNLSAAFCDFTWDHCLLITSLFDQPGCVGVCLCFNACVRERAIWAQMSSENNWNNLYVSSCRTSEFYRKNAFLKKSASSYCSESPEGLILLQATWFMASSHKQFFYGVVRNKKAVWKLLPYFGLITFWCGVWRLNKLELPPCGCTPPSTSQAVVYIHVCPHSLIYVVKTEGI